MRRYLPLARKIAHQHCRVASPRHDDVQSAALLGLVKSVGRYAPSRGNSFAVYARAMIRGEILRHIRDTRYVVHVPRPQHERYMHVRAVSRDLTVDLGRSPTTAELGVRLGWPPDDVLLALSTTRAEHAASIDGDTSDLSRRDFSDGLSRRVTVAHEVARLDERLQLVVRRRFLDDRSQQEIADELGVSQAHVSRLLARALTQLRSQFDEDALQTV